MKKTRELVKRKFFCVLFEMGEKIKMSDGNKEGGKMESILTSIKKLLGITEDYEHFDRDIIIHINSVFSILTQIGVGSETGFFIIDKTATWSDFISDNAKIEMVKTYVYLKVKLLFDPPLNSSVTNSMEKTISELEWRLNVETDGKEE